jgi:hypothetical protein
MFYIEVGELTICCSADGQSIGAASQVENNLLEMM